MTLQPDTGVFKHLSPDTNSQQPTANSPAHSSSERKPAFRPAFKPVFNLHSVRAAHILQPHLTFSPQLINDLRIFTCNIGLFPGVHADIEEI